MGLNFTLFNSLSENFICPRCHKKGGVTQFFTYRNSENACVSCKACGYTEIYDYNIQDSKYSILK